MTAALGGLAAAAALAAVAIPDDVDETVAGLVRGTHSPPIGPLVAGVRVTADGDTAVSPAGGEVGGVGGRRVSGAGSSKEILARILDRMGQLERP